MHNGIDIAMPVGTPLYAIADGTVEYGRNEIAGLYASFTSDKFPGLAFKLVHLSQGLGEPGTKREVKEGDAIGWSGGEKGNPNSGRSTGPHLHLGIKGDSGNWLRVRSGWLHWFITGKEPR
jgi:murein DD-endopeptidase